MLLVEFDEGTSIAREKGLPWERISANQLLAELRRGGEREIETRQIHRALRIMNLAVQGAHVSLEEGREALAIAENFLASL